jgi:hypothetical protein
MNMFCYHRESIPLWAHGSERFSFCANTTEDFYPEKESSITLEPSPSVSYDSEPQAWVIFKGWPVMSSFFFKLVHDPILHCELWLLS